MRHTVTHRHLFCLDLSVHPRRVGRPWIELSKSINLFLWDPFSTEYAKQNANQIFGKWAGLAFTGAIEKAETQCQNVNEGIVK